MGVSIIMLVVAGAATPDSSSQTFTAMVKLPKTYRMYHAAAQWIGNTQYSIWQGV